MNRVVLGTRGSDLALTQTRWTAARLAEAEPGLDVVLEIISTAGDRIQDKPLPEIGGKGLFTLELEEALREGRIDAAVHSIKDLPTELSPGLILGAIPVREDPADILYSTAGWTIETLPPGATVGTSSPRRRTQLLAVRPDLNIVDLRGNVPTRLRKVREGRVDAAVMAAAGLARLGLLDNECRPLSAQVMLSAPGQGALAIQIREGDPRMAALTALLHDNQAATEARAERAVLAVLGGGCSVPVGALARHESGILRLRACMGGDVSGPLVRVVVEGDPGRPEDLGAEAMRQLHKAVKAAAGGRLAGRRVLITRAPGQAAVLRESLERENARVMELPVITVEHVEDAAPPDAAVHYDWLILTSTNAVAALAGLLARHGRDLAGFKADHVCAIGAATAKALEEHGVQIDLIPAEAVAESLAAELARVPGGMLDKRVFLPQGNLARTVVADTLRKLGAQVDGLTVYNTLPSIISYQQEAAIIDFNPEVVTFTSSSTVINFWNGLLPETQDWLRQHSKFASIGPVTTRTADELGLAIAAEAVEHNIPGLVEALCRAFPDG